MPAHPLAIVSTGQERLGTPASVTATSAASPWQGFLVEHNRLPPTELPRQNLQHPLIAVVVNPVELEWIDVGGVERRYLTRPGDVAIAPSGETPPARWRQPGEMISVTLDSSYLERAAAELTRGKSVELRFETHHENLVIRNLIMALREEMIDGCPAGKLFGESVGTALAARLVARHSVAMPVVREYKGGLSMKVLKRVQDYIDANLATDLRISELAGVALMSPFYFARLFRQATGESVHQFVLAQRLSKAKRLLSTSDQSVVEVGASCGFLNQSHFTSMFKKRVGVTPRQFRLRSR